MTHIFKDAVLIVDLALQICAAAEQESLLPA